MVRGLTSGHLELSFFRCLRANIPSIKMETQKSRMSKGFATLIQQKIPDSKVMVFSDYRLGVSNDENWRWPNNIIDL